MTNDDDKLELVEGGWRVRIRYGKNLRQRFTIRLEDEAAARCRAAELRSLANMLARAGHSAEAPLILRKAAAVQTDRQLAEVVEVAEKLCAGKVPAAKLAARSVTFQQLGEDWTSGRLHKRYPDQIKLKRTADDDEGRLKLHVYPVLGSKAVPAITLDDAEEVMRRLPASLSPLTRRGVGHLMARLLKLAVYPLRLIPASPIPDGFLPRRGTSKALACLYPDEDHRLLECGDVPFCYRLLWGFLTREGMREGEALALTWAELDLVRGAVRLDRNKTDDPRAWALDKGTTEALCAYYTRMRADAEPDELVFVDPHGRPHSKFGMAALLRSHLEAIGLKKERPELFASSDQRKRIRVHDLRGTFVTVSLANNRTESWISDRTGHRSSAMINRYKRVARSFQELNLGKLLPLHDALPELRSVNAARVQGGPATGPIRDESASKKGVPNGIRTRAEHTASDAPELKSAEPGAGESASVPQGPPLPAGVGHELAQVAAPAADAVELALAAALDRASMAGEWGTARVLATELEARRRARLEVVDLEAARAKRGRP